jgi:hypothetical protein
MVAVCGLIGMIFAVSVSFERLQFVLLPMEGRIQSQQMNEHQKKEVLTI